MPPRPQSVQMERSPADGLDLGLLPPDLQANQFPLSYATQHVVICCGSPRRWTQAHSSTRHRDGPPARPRTAGACAASSPGSHVPSGPHVTGGVDPPGSPGSLPLRILPLHQPARRGSSSHGCWDQAPAGVGHSAFLDASPA